VSAAGRGCPNQIGPHLEQRIVAFALGHPGFGPRRISAELARDKSGGIRISEHGVWRVLVPVGLNTRAKRLALVARHRDPYERKPDPPPPERHIDATVPGEKVQLDGFYVGRLSGTKGTVWQYTAIDVPPHSAGPNCTPQSATPAPATPASCCTASPASSPPPAGNSTRSPPITDPSSAPATSEMPSSAWAPANASSAPADPTPTAASSAPS
jgi:hypothetical protein